MTTDADLNAHNLVIEAYGGGFMIADYSGRFPTRFGARYCGMSFAWRKQPLCADPFPTRQAAIKAAATLLPPPAPVLPS